MGFGARGLAMGNAMVSNIDGNVSGYYNPALACYQELGVANLGYTFLSLDRRLNYIGFAKKFKLAGDYQGAGISASWINAGVGDIDGRDNDTRKTDVLSTFENQFYLGLGFILNKELSIGIGFKLYYAKLYDKIATNSVGLDIGFIFKPMNNVVFGLAVRDLAAKYKWETSSIYGQYGNTTEDKFPVLLDLGATYLLPKSFGTVSAEVETFFSPNFKSSDLVSETSITGDRKKYFYSVKVGAEIKITEQIQVRAGLDRVMLNGDDFGGELKPSFGFGFEKNFSENTQLGLDYSFQLEPYTRNPIQNIGLLFKFK